MSIGQIPESRASSFEAVIREHDDFEDCQIIALRFRRYQTELAADIRKPNGEKCRLVFKAVREVRISNGLGPETLRRPKRMNWSMNEISLLAVIAQSELVVPYVDEESPPLHFAFQWEPSWASPGRQIDIVAGQMLVACDID